MDLLSFTSASGVRHTIERTAEGALLDHASFNCDAVLDHAKAMSNENDGYSPSRDIRRCAFIPDIVALKWLNEEGWWVYDPEASHRLKRKLNDPDWSYLRTASGQV